MQIRLISAVAQLAHSKPAILVSKKHPISGEKPKVFLEKVKSDDSLQEKLKAAKSPQEIVDVAKQNGYELSSEKLIHFSNEELEPSIGEQGGCTGSYNTSFVNGCGVTKHKPALASSQMDAENYFLVF